jgi:hypothetical protein
MLDKSKGSILYGMIIVLPIGFRSLVMTIQQVIGALLVIAVFVLAWMLFRYATKTKKKGPPRS